MGNKLNNNGLDFDTIKRVFEELKMLKPIEIPEMKCGELFKKLLLDSCDNVVIKDIPFAKAVINPTLFGMKVTLDETLPSNMARIGNTFIQLK